MLRMKESKICKYKVVKIMEIEEFKVEGTVITR